VAKRIVWTDQAKSDIRSIEQHVAIRILKTLGRYLLTGEGGAKQLTGLILGKHNRALMRFAPSPPELTSVPVD
jgi:hypothetical protein